MSNIHEECGVFGVYTSKPYEIAKTVYYGLYALQHRGQESCGIVVNDDGLFTAYKDTGLVNDVFTPEHMAQLSQGNIAIGHVRYGTTGGSARDNAQPIVVNHINGRVALAHNGNLTNSYELRRDLELKGSIFHTTSDTEVISYIITEERLTAPSIEEAVNRALNRIKGAYSLVIMSPTKMIAARDEMGFRPLCIGRLPEEDGYVVASESCALDAVGAEFVRDVEPGEIVVFDGKSVRSIKDHCGKAKPHTCVFEYIYFARPDSVIDGASVHEARIRAGAFLALEHPVQADVVIGVPDSGLDAALGFSKQSGIPYEIGFIKNKYIGRTFISPGQKSRTNQVRIKLNPITNVIKGKRVVMIDDSIVRGTTCARIVKLLRNAGAKEIHMRVSAPPFLHPCFFGTDVPDRKYLIAHGRTVEEIRDLIGVDSLGYLSVEAAHKIAVGANCGFCDGCFTGKYPVKTPDTVEKNIFESGIGENA